MKIINPNMFVHSDFGWSTQATPGMRQTIRINSLIKGLINVLLLIDVQNSILCEIFFGGWTKIKEQKPIMFMFLEFYQIKLFISGWTPFLSISIENLWKRSIVRLSMKTFKLKANRFVGTGIKRNIKLSIFHQSWKNRTYVIF